MQMQTLLILFIGLAIVLVARWRGWLTIGGAMAALAVGGLALGLGGIAFVVPLLIFFITSSLLSKASNRSKKAASRHFDKNEERDAIQVLANGGLAALAALGFGITTDPHWFAFFVGAMATATADTWATELGTLSNTPPRSIATGKAVSPGMSGGVSLLGLSASIAGGLLIGLSASLAGGGAMPRLLIAGGLSGLMGSIMDSVLGATVQRHFWNPAAQELTEKAEHEGEALQLRRGIYWINNDVVNLLAALFGGLVALIIMQLM